MSFDENPAPLTAFVINVLLGGIKDQAPRAQNNS